MKKKESIEDFSLDELKIIKSFVSKYDDTKSVKNELNKMIKESCEKLNDMNHRLTIELMEQLHFFDREMFDILKSHGIKNIQDLIDSDLNTWELTGQRRLELEEAKVWYDFSHLEKNFGKEKQKKKNKT